MSIHTSLSAKKGSKHRSVLKRYERIQCLKKKEKWTEETSAYNLPKIKNIKVKIKKTKTAAAKTETPAATASTKEGSGAKAAGKK
ncbi:MAG: small basic protein [Candidatus Omnitrophota bacterium]